MQNRMGRYVVGGDVGGSKVNLAIYEVTENEAPAPVRETSFDCRRYRGLEEVVKEFLAAGNERIAAAGFGVAGPVLGRSVKLTNLPWVVNADRLGEVMNTRRVVLVNDLQATAYGALFLPPERLHTLNAGKPQAGNRAVIAAGTGLGEAALFWDGCRYRPSASEGGHVDFGPRNAEELEFLRFLQAELGRVSYERVLCGPGLVRIFRFFEKEAREPVAPVVRQRMRQEDPAAVIGAAGVADLCPVCARTVDLFVRIYGAQAGNLALAVLAVGGVYVGGGIVGKLLKKFTGGGFMEAFIAKEPYETLMRDIPVHVLLDPKAGQLGAAHLAAALPP